MATDDQARLDIPAWHLEWASEAGANAAYRAVHNLVQERSGKMFAAYKNVEAEALRDMASEIAELVAAASVKLNAFANREHERGREGFPSLMRQKPAEQTSEKPHKGRIEKWTKLPCTSRGLGYIVCGHFVDHDRFAGKDGHTSAIIAHDSATGEIETLNSRYTLIGPELTE